MDALLEAILGNFMIIIIIIGGIFSFLKNKSEQEKQENQERQQPVNPHRTSRPEAPAGRYQAEKQNTAEPLGEWHDSQQAAQEMQSVEDLRKEQLKKLAGRVEADVTQKADEPPHTKKAISAGKQPKQTKTLQRQPAKERVRKNLTRQGLVQSVIMSEVLGPSKAEKPYRPITENRRRH